MAKPKIKPLGDRVLVQAVEEKEQIRGGIVIPDAAKEKPQQAKVIALGTGKVDEDGMYYVQLYDPDIVMIGFCQQMLMERQYTLYAR